MKALSLRQPWATLIALGAKKIETRSWSTSYRGPLAIHAAKTWNDELDELSQSWPFGEVLPLADLPRGCIVAVANLTGCRQVTRRLISHIEEQCLIAANASDPECEFFYGNYEVGRWLWALSDVRALPTPIPATGHQGLWEWEAPQMVLEMAS